MIKKVLFIAIAILLSAETDCYANGYHCRLSQRVKNALVKHEYNPSGFKHGNSYYATECRFDTWSWYYFCEYPQRFKQNNTNKNEYFDLLLGYYVHGRMCDPVALEIGDCLIYENKDYLVIETSDKVILKHMFETDLDYLYFGNLKVVINTRSGRSIIQIRDNLGNVATYDMYAV